MVLTAYGPLCTEVYEITKPIGQDYPDIPYYIKHLSSIGGRILEAMVGTGRLLIPLLEAGINVEGIDTSPDMLAACRKHCIDRNLNPVLHQGCVENLDISGRYSAIAVSFGSFMLLEKRTAAVAALQAFARHLEPQGRIFIDLELPIEDFKTENIVKQLLPINCPDGSTILLQSTSRIDWLNQVNTTVIRYEKWKEGKLVATELQNLSLHWFGRDEFIMCLRENGYKEIALCANYTDHLKPNSYKDTLCFSAVLA
ncbi:class I SAM-dependent methyltransferase [Nostoc cf. edaphicum LEGE 07299]|uniref:Class I SAM-dependent methyltransferase n=1 Tax=Nostoc cf. edaphicum LEGE 07299 TaxID=2777974 RepID=A0ABR9U1Z5_9NOSO|nr:class I SAM-dependent methyltransferase [Nostoc edaphicum]MBE9106681.1 class I SAM-dependent methyltransferase [Nostoc cf. edaphicum LEGE 07299]